MSLTDLLGLEGRQLISLVGGGGKSTMLFRLGNELAGRGGRVILTTTTKMGRRQADAAAAVCWSSDAECAVAALDQSSPVMLLADGDDHKVRGPSPELIDDLFAAPGIDHILVEADGSRGRPLKAPAGFEPVVPSASTLVVILVGVDAVGHRLGNVTHRVEVASRFTNRDADHVLTADDCATILLHEDGALRSCPPTARVVVAITKASSAVELSAAAELRAAVTRMRPEMEALVVPG